MLRPNDCLGHLKTFNFFASKLLGLALYTSEFTLLHLSPVNENDTPPSCRVFLTWLDAVTFTFCRSILFLSTLVVFCGLLDLLLLLSSAVRSFLIKKMVFFFFRLLMMTSLTRINTDLKRNNRVQIENLDSTSDVLCV